MAAYGYSPDPTIYGPPISIWNAGRQGAAPAVEPPGGPVYPPEDFLRWGVGHGVDIEPLAPPYGASVGPFYQHPGGISPDVNVEPPNQEPYFQPEIPPYAWGVGHGNEFPIEPAIPDNVGMVRAIIPPRPPLNPVAPSLPPEINAPANTPDSWNYGFGLPSPYSNLATSSLMSGEDAATADRQIRDQEGGPFTIDTPLGQINVSELWKNKLKPALGNFLDLNARALAEGTQFGDWGWEPQARAQYRQEGAAAAANQALLLEQIKKGPTGMIDASWKADTLRNISKFSGARRLMDDMRKLVSAHQVGGVWRKGANMFNEIGDFLGIPATGQTKTKHLNALRAQLIANLQGAFGREINSHEHKLIKQMLPSAGWVGSSLDIMDALDEFQKYMDNKLDSEMDVAIGGGFGDTATQLQNNATYQLIGQNATTNPTQTPTNTSGNNSGAAYTINKRGQRVAK